MDEHSNTAAPMEHHEKPKIFSEPKREPVKSSSSPQADSQKPKDHSNVMIGLGIVQIIVLIFIAFQLSSIDLSPTGAVIADAPAPAVAAAPTPSAAPSAPVVDIEKLIDDDSVKGDPDAPVTIVEFSDFECPFCARFYTGAYAQIDQEYIQTGKVKLVYRDFPLSFHPNAQKAAEAAECAGEQGKYFEMHDILFERGVTGGSTSYKAFATEIGLDEQEFASCLDSGEMAAEVRQDMADGQRAGVQGTPAFFVNGQLISGAQPFPAFQAAIEQALAE